MAFYYLEIIVLSFIQGFSEFIPVSSSAHLIIARNLANFEVGSLELDIGLHLGSLLAIIFYFTWDFAGFLDNSTNKIRKWSRDE